MRAIIRALGAVIGTIMVVFAAFFLLAAADIRDVLAGLGIAVTGCTLAYYGFTGRSRYDQSVTDALNGSRRRPKWDD
jgi:multisubunit Na+/H+ antiporter MnhC subunit